MQGEWLVQLGLLRPEGLEAASRRQAELGGDIEEAVLALQLLSERDLLRAKARERGVQYLTTEKVSDLKVPDEVLERIPVRVAEALSVMPFRANPDGTLWVLTSRELTPEEIDQLRRLSDAKSVGQILARKRAIKAAQRRHYYRDHEAFRELEEAELVARLAPPVPDTVLEIDITTDPGHGKNQDDIDTKKVIVALPEEVANLQRENEQLRIAHQLAAAVANLHDLHAIADEFLAAMLDLYSAEVVGFALTGDHGAPLLLESRRRQGEHGKVEISAQIVATVVDSKQPLMLMDAQPPDVQRRARSILAAPLAARSRQFGALYLESPAPSAFDADDLGSLTLLGTVGGAALESAIGVQRLEERIITRTALRHFLPVDVVERTLAGTDPVSLAPVRAQATVLAVRLAEPSIWARNLDADTTLQRLGDAQQSILSYVHANGGALEVLSPTLVTAVFGPPRGELEHLDRALVAAIEMSKDAARKESVNGPGLLSIGVAGGELTIGGVGPPARVQLAVLGDAAELARRLAELAKPGELLATADTHDASGRFFSWEEHAQTVEFWNEPRAVFRMRWR